MTHFMPNRFACIVADCGAGPDLHCSESGLTRCANAHEDVVVTARNSGDAGKGLGIDRIHAGCDAVQARSLERCSEPLTTMAVGGEGDVERLCRGIPRKQLDSVVGICSAQLRELLDHIEQAGAEERLATGTRTFSMPRRAKTRIIRR
jgi:hypothetical protein